MTDPITEQGPNRPIFIVGCARSGTTLLQLMLHRHPRIALPPETRFLMPLYDRRAEFGDPNDAEARARIADFILDRKKSKVHDLELDTEAVRQGILDAAPTVGSMAAEVFRAYAHKFDKPRWGDKRPNYIRRLDVVLRLFPDAQILHIVRDGRDCVSSLKRMPWWNHGTVAAIAKWVDAMQKGEQAREQLRADQYHEFRYEDLVAEPRDVLAGICAFLGEDFHEAMLEPAEAADVAVPDRKHWHERTHAPVNAKAVRRWEDDLTPTELRLMEAVAGAHLRSWGYELSEGRRPLPPIREVVDYFKQVRARRNTDARNADRDRELQREYPYEVAAQLEGAGTPPARA